MNVGPVAITHPEMMNGIYQQIDYNPNVEGLLEEMTLTKLSLGLLVFQEHSFPSLSSLIIDQCADLHTILIENDVMDSNVDEKVTPKDSRLLIYECNSLEVLTIGRRSCCSVNRFEIMSMFWRMIGVILVECEKLNVLTIGRIAHNPSPPSPTPEDQTKDSQMNCMSQCSSFTLQSMC